MDTLIYGYIINIRQLCISRKQITSAYLNFRQWSFSHRKRNMVCKYLLHCHLQIFFQGIVILKIRFHFLSICAKLLCKIEKFVLAVVSVGILRTGFCFQGSHNISYREIAAKRVTSISFLSLISLKILLI